MQIKQVSPSLWRVSWVHRCGSQAPEQFVEVAPHYYGEPKRLHPSCRTAAIKLAKQQSRLGDFPEKWSCHVTNLSDPRV